jgi:hypothetical protein
MKQIHFNPSNSKYYSDDFIKGFECGTKKQYEADIRFENNRKHEQELRLDNDAIKYYDSIHTNTTN